MKTVEHALLAALLAVATTSSLAQATAAGKPARAASAPTNAAPAGSAPVTGMGMGMGRRGGHREGRWGAASTPGWTMMTDDERKQHQARMQAMSSYDECRTYMDQHHVQMSARAAERGASMPGQARRDACAGLKK